MEINLLLIVVAFIAVMKMIDGYKKGLVKEAISLVSLIVLCIFLCLVAGAISNYNEGNILHVVVAVIMLAVLGLVHHVLRVIFFPAKIVSKLPVVSFANKLSGIVFGLAEVVLFLWVIYVLIMFLDLGAIEQVILSYAQESKVLSWFYQHNYLAYFMELGLTKIRL